MPVSGEASYISRFVAKFIEIIAAGIATAVSGYLLAQFGGHLSASTPNPSPTQPASEFSRSTPASQVQPVAATAPQPARARTADPSAEEPAREPAKASKAAPRKQVKADSSVAEKKPHAEDSVEALVRAALVKGDGNQAAAPDVPPHQAGVPPRNPGIGVEPRAVEPRMAEPHDVPAGTAAMVPPPRAADVVPRPVEVLPESVQPRLVQPGSPASLGTSTPPVAYVGRPPPIPRAPTENATPAEHKGMFSWLSRDPGQRRVPAPTGEAPRPPMPVGEPAQAPM